MPPSNFWTEDSAEVWQRAVEIALRALHEEPSVFAVEHLLEALVQHANRQQRDGLSRDEVHRQLMQRVTDVLCEARRELFSFIFQTSTLAGAARDDEQLATSWRRSAIQLAADEHAAALAALEEWRKHEVNDLLESIDDDLRRMGTDYGRLPDDDLPTGLPSTHWWWWPEPRPDYRRGTVWEMG